MRTCEVLSSVGVHSQPYLSPGPHISHVVVLVLADKIICTYVHTSLSPRAPVAPAGASLVSAATLHPSHTPCFRLRRPTKPKTQTLPLPLQLDLRLRNFAIACALSSGSGRLWV